MMPGSFRKMLILALSIATCSAFIQEISLYTGTDCTGGAITFQTKEAQLTNWEFFLPSINSVKVHGWWVLYSGANFNTYLNSYSYRPTFVCINSTHPKTSRSLRHLGPSQTDTLSLSVYESGSWVGRELIITAPAATNFGFVATYGVASDYSSWTLYTNADFTGASVCVAGNGGLVSRTFTFRSATSGCNKDYKLRGTKTITDVSKFYYF